MKKRDEELYFYSVHSGAGLDLVWQHNGYLLAYEFKFTDAPTITKSIAGAMQDLQIKKLWIMYPGQKPYMLSDNIHVLPYAHMPDALQYE